MACGRRRDRQAVRPIGCRRKLLGQPSIDYFRSPRGDKRLREQAMLREEMLVFLTPLIEHATRGAYNAAGRVMITAYSLLGRPARLLVE